MIVYYHRPSSPPVFPAICCLRYTTYSLPVTSFVHHDDDFERSIAPPLLLSFGPHRPHPLS